MEAPVQALSCHCSAAWMKDTRCNTTQAPLLTHTLTLYIVKLLKAGDSCIGPPTTRIQAADLGKLLEPTN